MAAALAWHWLMIQRGAAGAALVLSIAAVAAGFRWGAFVAGGSDSYCYLNQAELLARGVVHDFEPLSADLGWPGNVWSFVPAGHIPIGSTSPALVPICPAGYPLIMAAARRTIGRQAMFWITPLMGGIAVGLAFLLGRRLAGPAAGLLTAALTLASPTFLMQLFQPMNDVTATAAWCAALVVAMQRRTAGSDVAPALAGLLTGVALIVRPNLLPLALVVGLGLGARAFLAHAAGATSGWSSCSAGGAAGGRAGDGDSERDVWLALQVRLRRPRHDVLRLACVAEPAAVSPMADRDPHAGHRRRDRRAVGAERARGEAARRSGCWCSWRPRWPATCRMWCSTPGGTRASCCPRSCPVLALTAAVAVMLIGRLPAAARAIVFALLACTLVALSIRTGIPRDVFRIRDLEWRFRSAGECVAAMPASAALITLHHSGSVRFYAGRSTLGWADIDKGRLDDALSFLRRHGSTPYLMFEPWEEPQFRERFAGERLGALDWPPLAEVDGVRIYDPDDYDRHRRGEPIATERIVTSTK